MNRLYAYVALAAAAALLAWRGTGTPGPADAARPAQAGAGAAAPTAASEHALELQRRTLSDRRSDLFGTPPKPPAPPRPKPVVELPPAPKAPPLPYKYDGNGELQGKRFVYLAREGKSSTLVSAGDTLDGTYLVETVGRDRVTLRYLPLGLRQVLMYAGGEAPAELAAAPEKGQPVALQVDMPGEVVVGQEFVVTLALPGAGALKATVEVRYDTEVLRMMGPNARRPGRAVVEVASGSTPRAQLRFKVLADSPASTDIDLTVNATDPSGKRVPVSSPPAQTVSLVLPGA